MVSFTREEQAVITKAKNILLGKIKTQDVVFNSPAVVKDYCQLNAGHYESEIFGVLFLNTKHQLIASRILFHGSIAGASVYPREVIKQALKFNASAVIFFHNHPSGDTEPSSADRDLTKRLRDILGEIDVRVLDHMIVSHKETTSMVEYGWL